MISYRVTLETDDNETVLVTSADIPLVTYGEDRESALRHAVEAAEAIIASLMAAGEDVPPSSPPTEGTFIRLPLQATLKVELYIALRAAGLTRADLQRRLDWQRESVDRLFRLDHNSRIEQIEQAFAAIGKTVVVLIREPIELMTDEDAYNMRRAET